MTELRGKLAGEGLRIGIALSRFNEPVTEGLLAGARRALTEHGVDAADIDVARVPGAFELPLVSRELAETGRYSAVVALGAVIRGETAHFDFIAAEAARGIAEASLETRVPVLFGVLTTEDGEQALARSRAEEDGGKDKGAEVALAALEMVNLLAAIRGG